MNKYLRLKRQQERERKQFPIFFPTNEKEFEESMRKLGLNPTDTDKICRVHIDGICNNGLIRCDNTDALIAMFKRHKTERMQALSSDKTGEYAYDMFYYELCNHEYAYTHNATAALAALGYTTDDINACLFLKQAFEKAALQCEKDCNA